VASAAAFFTFSVRFLLNSAIPSSCRAATSMFNYNPRSSQHSNVSSFQCSSQQFPFTISQLSYEVFNGVSH
jgi:hypothetical protein